MPTQFYAANCDNAAGPRIGIVRRAARHELAPDGARVLELADRAALLYVQFGVLAIDGRSGPRALPGEWLHANGVAALNYANASRTEVLRVFEIVFERGGDGLEAGVEQRYFSDDERAEHLCPVAAREPGAGATSAMKLGLDASVYVTTLGRWSTVLHDLSAGRCAFAWMLSGDGTVNNQKLESGDSATISDEDEVRICGGAGADVMLLDAPCAALDGTD